MRAISQPVLIVLATRPSDGRLTSGPLVARTVDPGEVLFTTLLHALASEMAVLLVATPTVAQDARSLLAWRDIVTVPTPMAHPHRDGYAIAMGVAARPHAAGWLVLPGDMPLVQPASMQAVARGLTQSPVAYARHGGRSGHPVGYSSELYSELIHLNDADGPRRLRSRYPAQGVDVPDPGVLVDADEIDDYDLLRQSYGVPPYPDF